MVKPTVLPLFHQSRTEWVRATYAGLRAVHMSLPLAWPARTHIFRHTLQRILRTPGLDHRELIHGRR